MLDQETLISHANWASGRLYQCGNPRQFMRVLEAIRAEHKCDTCQNSGLFIYPSTAMGSGVGGSSMTTGPCPGTRRAMIDSDCSIWLHMKKQEIEAPKPGVGSAHPRVYNMKNWDGDNRFVYAAETWDGVHCWFLDDETQQWELPSKPTEWSLANEVVMSVLQLRTDYRLAARPG